MEDLISALRGIDGASLRVVATVGSLDYDIEYIQEDLESEYSRADFEAAYREVVSNLVSAENFGTSVGIGKPDAQTYFYNDVTVFLFPSARYEAIFASFDRQAPFPVNEIVVTACDNSV